MKQLISLLIIIGLIFVLYVVVSDMPTFGSQQVPSYNQMSKHYLKEGVHEVESLNIVNAIVVDYRGYDTLIETIVLFTISTSVMALLYNK